MAHRPERRGGGFRLYTGRVPQCCKIGLEIDFEHDVIVEVYNSWYSFFGVTRELIKAIPIAQAQGSPQIIDLSVEVLNQGLRPHLTQWQARFRHWYEAQLKAAETSGTTTEPQTLQKQYPRYAELESDMKRINGHLIAYRRQMHSLAFGD